MADYFFCLSELINSDCCDRMPIGVPRFVYVEACVGVFG